MGAIFHANGKINTANSGTFKCPDLSSTTQSTESNIQIANGVAGVWSGLEIHINNGGTGINNTSRVNTANGNMVVTPPDSTSGYFSDNVHSDSVGVNDLFDVSLTQTTNPSYLSTRLVFTATSGHASPYWSTNGVTVGASATRFVIGPISNATEANAAFVVRAAGTYSKTTYNVNTNVSNGTTTVTSRKNLGAGNQSFTVASSTTGTFSDATNTDHCANGDQFCFSVANGGSSGNVGPGFMFYVFTSDGLTSEVIGNGNVAILAAATAPNNTEIVGLLGPGSFSTEADAGIHKGFSGSCSNMRGFISSNSTNGTMIWTLRINQANGNQTITVGGGVTGAVEDTTHSDNFGSTDILNYQGTVGTASSGSVTFQHTELTDAVPAPPGGTLLTSSDLGPPVIRVAQVMGW